MSRVLGTSGLTPAWSQYETSTQTFVPQAREYGVVSIFIIEDDDKLRAEIKTYLHKTGCCQVISDTAKAENFIDEVKRHRPDVVLLKLSLSGFDGLQATQQIKQLLPQTKVMILGGANDSDSDIYESFNAGANGYRLRDTPVSKLVNDLLAIADGARWVDPHFSKRSSRHLSKTSAKISLPPQTEPVLSEREMEVLRLLAEGMSNQEIGKRLIVSAETVKTHVKHIMEKLAVNDRTLAVVTALRKGML